MRVLRISLLSLLTVGLLSASLYADKKREEGFFYPDKLPFPDGWQIDEVDLENAYEASQAFPLPSSKCSGAYISSDGYYLTAYHCLLSALEEI